jgi:hypothetical protein
MKAVPMTMTERPGFDLMKETDVQSFYHMQMPRFLFFDRLYAPLSLEAKVAYTFLLNRFQLSKLNGWTGDGGEVFVIYTRKSLANEMQISYRKTISAMKELSDADLIWEKRRGRGDANQIYLARVESSGENTPKYASAPFVSADDEAAGAEPAARSAKTALHTESALPETSAKAPSNAAAALPCSQDMPKPHFKTYENDTPRDADFAHQEVPNPHSKKKDLRKKYINKGLSVRLARARESPHSDDERELDGILAKCELWVFDPQTANVFENAIERLYYAESYRVCGATLPQERVRARLRKLGNICLQDAERKIAQNTHQKIRDTTAYTMAVVFNSVTESQSDLMFDPYLNSLKASWGSGIERRNRPCFYLPRITDLYSAFSKRQAYFPSLMLKRCLRRRARRSAPVMRSALYRSSGICRRFAPKQTTLYLCPIFRICPRTATCSPRLMLCLTFRTGKYRP